MKEKAFAVTKCRVIVVKQDDGTDYGNRVYVQDNEGYSLMYAHLDSINVSVGDNLDKDDVIGEIGSTGYCPSGAHLHVSLFPVGATSLYAKDAIDPKEYFIKNMRPSRTILTNPFGSKKCNPKLSGHEGNDFSSYRLRACFT